MGLYLLDYGAGNVRSLANTLTKLGYEFKWITSADDFAKASVRVNIPIRQLECVFSDRVSRNSYFQV